MFPEHLQTGWWEKPSRNRMMMGKKSPLNAKLKPAKLPYLLFFILALWFSTFVSLLLCSRGLKWPPSIHFSIFSVNYFSKPGSNSVFVSLSPYTNPSPSPGSCFSLFDIPPKQWLLALTIFLLPVSVNVFPIYSLLLGIHLLPETLYLHAKECLWHQFSFPSVYTPCYCQRQLSEIQTTPLI